MTTASARALGVANLIAGAVMAARPQAVAHAAGRPGARPHPGIVRVLGLRQLAQGAVTLVSPSADVLWLGAAVDSAHAASMLPFAVTRFRRAALLSAAIAASSALIGRELA
ncbi:hypothetical protein [Jatrophihabitans fulvus]